MSGFDEKNIDTHDKDDKDDLIKIIGTFFSGENTNLISYIISFGDDDFLKILRKHETTLNNIKLNNPTPGIKVLLDNHNLLIELAEWVISKNNRVILSFLEIIIEVLDNLDLQNSDATSKYTIFLSKITDIIDTLKQTKNDINQDEDKQNNIQLNHDHITYIIIFLIFTIKSDEIIGKINIFNNFINNSRSSISCIINQIKITLQEKGDGINDLKKLVIDTILKKEDLIQNNLKDKNNTLHRLVFKTISILDKINKFQIIEKTIILDCEVIIINELLKILGDKVTTSVTQLINGMQISIGQRTISIIEHIRAMIKRNSNNNQTNNNLSLTWAIVLKKMLNLTGGKTIKRNKKILNISRKIRR